MTLTDTDDGRLRSVRFWHTLAPDEVLRALGTDKACGLSGKEARSRLDAHGDNRLPEKPPRSPWWLFIDQFKSLLILVLIGRIGVTGWRGHAGRVRRTRSALGDVTVAPCPTKPARAKQDLPRCRRGGSRLLVRVARADPARAAGGHT